MHMFQGAVDVKDVSFEKDVLDIRINHFMQENRKLFVAYPSRYRYRTLETNGHDVLIDNRKKGLLSVEFTGKRNTWMKIRWKRT